MQKAENERFGGSKQPFVEEESKDPHIKKTIYQTPQSQISQSTFSSESLENSDKSLS